MSALIYVVEQDSIAVYTDTLMVNEHGEDLHHTSKALYLPHLNVIICGLGVAGLADHLFLQANASPLEDLTDLTRLAENLLPHIWVSELNLSVIDATHISSTVYLFGFDPESNTPLAFAHRSANGFESEQIAKQPPRMGLKPTDGIDISTLSIKDDDDAAHAMIKQMAGQTALPEDRRVYIGGVMLKLLLMPRGMITAQVIDLDETMKMIQNRR